MKTTLKLLIIGLIILLNSCKSTLFMKKEDIQLYLFTENGKYGFINQKGKVMVKPVYDYHNFEYSYHSDFFSGDEFCEVELNGKHGVIDYKGKVIIAPQYDEIKIEDELYFIAKLNNKWGVLNYGNNIIFPFIFNDRYDLNLYSDCGYGKINDVVYKLDYKTKEMTPTKYADVYVYYKDFPEVKVNGKYGFMNKKGEIIIQPVFEEVKRFNNGLAPVKIEKKWGFIDTLGQAVIEPQFDDVESFGYGENSAFAVAKNYGKYGVINRKGMFVLQPKYDNLRFVSAGLMEVSIRDEKYGNRWGLINIKGEWVLPNIYEEIDYSEGYVTYKNENDLFGVIELKTKKVIIPFEYESIGYYDDEGLTLFSKMDKDTETIYYGYFDKKGKVIWRQKTEELK